MAGRPKLPADQVRGTDLRIRMTREQRDLLDAVAAKALRGKTVPGSGVTSTWARDVLLKAAKRAADRG